LKEISEQEFKNLVGPDQEQIDLWMADSDQFDSEKDLNQHEVALAGEHNTLL
jgi:hypothetical protein